MDGGRDTDAHNLREHFLIELQVFELDLDAGIRTEQRDHRKHGGDALRDDGRIRNALDAHAERQHEDEIENDVEHGGDDEEIERALGIAHGAQNARAHVVEHKANDAREVDGEVRRGLRHDLGRGLHEIEHEGNHGDADDCKEHGQNERHDDGSVDSIAHLIIPLCAVILRNDDAGTAGKP